MSPLKPKTCGQALEGCQDKARIDAELAKGMVPRPKPWPAPPEGPPTRKITEGVRIHDEVTPAGQSRSASLTESLVNIVIGFVVSVLITAAVLPWYGHAVTLHENLQITAIFTVASLARSYWLRRLFNFLHLERT